MPSIMIHVPGSTKHCISDSSTALLRSLTCTSRMSVTTCTALLRSLTCTSHMSVTTCISVTVSASVFHYVFFTFLCIVLHNALFISYMGSPYTRSMKHLTPDKLFLFIHGAVNEHDTTGVSRRGCIEIRGGVDEMSGSILVAAPMTKLWYVFAGQPRHSC